MRPVNLAYVKLFMGLRWLSPHISYHIISVFLEVLFPVVTRLHLLNLLWLELTELPGAEIIGLELDSNSTSNESNKFDISRSHCKVSRCSATFLGREGSKLVELRTLQPVARTRVSKPTVHLDEGRSRFEACA